MALASLFRPGSLFTTYTAYDSLFILNCLFIRDLTFSFPKNSKSGMSHILYYENSKNQMLLSESNVFPSIYPVRSLVNQMVNWPTLWSPFCLDFLLIILLVSVCLLLICTAFLAITAHSKYPCSPFLQLTLHLLPYYCKCKMKIVKSLSLCSSSYP